MVQNVTTSGAIKIKLRFENIEANLQLRMSWCNSESVKGEISHTNPSKGCDTQNCHYTLQIEILFLFYKLENHPHTFHTFYTTGRVGISDTS